MNRTYTEDYLRFIDENGEYTNFYDFNKNDKPPKVIPNNYILRSSYDFWFAHSINSEIKCIIINIMEIIAEENKISIEDITINELFNKIEYLQKNSSTLNPILRRLIFMVPSKYHIFEYLFDFNSDFDKLYVKGSAS